MRICVLFIALILSMRVYGADAPQKVLHVASDRPLSYLKPLIKDYEKHNKIKIEIEYHEEDLPVWLRANPQKADLILSRDFLVLEGAKRDGLLRLFTSKTIETNIISTYREPQDLYTGLTSHARVIFYSKKRVKPDQLSTYFNLAEPRWFGKVCMGPGHSPENLTLFAQMAADNGMPKLKAFLRDLKGNLAQTPKGDDAAQIQAIANGKCDVALADTRTMGLMWSKGGQRALAQAAEIFFPNQNVGGSYVVTSGAALTSAIENESSNEAKRRATATQFLAWLSSTQVQRSFSQNTYEYPLNPSAEPHELLASLGRGQKVEHGLFEKRYVSPAAVLDLREEVIKLLDEIHFDGVEGKEAPAGKGA